MTRLAKQLGNVDQALADLVRSRDEITDPVDLLRIGMAIDDELDRRIALMKERDGYDGLSAADARYASRGAYQR